jgi:hypothetical protein
VAPGASCQIGVRFAPQAAGASSATVTLLTNAAPAPQAVALSGVGGGLPQGPAGATGPAGAAGRVELVSCKTVTRTVTKIVKHKRRKVRVSHQQCRARLISGTVKFTTQSATVTAQITRAGRVYATGEQVGRSELVLTPIRALRPGRYTLALTHGARAHRTTARRSITIT